MEHTISHKTRLFTSLLQWWQDAGVDIETLHHPGPTPSSPDTSNTPASLQPTLKDTTPSRPPKESTPSPLRSQTTMNTSPSSQELFSQNDVFTRAREQAAKATSPEDLKERISAFDAGELSQGARQAVFARGDASSPIMVVGEAPGRDEDIQGLPFVGRSGKLLDKMFSAIGFEPGSVYISNIVNWRPPNNRTPSREEMAMCLPFIERHIAFIRPSFLVLAGSVAVQALLRTSVGITKNKGTLARLSPQRSPWTSN